ncbi:AraC family transcriptional regulator [Alteromonas sp. P256]|uniref:AraC family transcriptional regulator n=1 Tax=Alteromonas sp. P256 TaxID=3117399 RepID=UPI002FE4141E
MSKVLIKQIINSKANENGLIDTGIHGVKLFKITESVRCAPAVYEPSITAIVSGDKEAILDGKKHFYDSNAYISCTVPLPVEAGTPSASPDNPLIGVYITLDTRMMTELAIEMESTSTARYKTNENSHARGLSIAAWDEDFTDALIRLLALDDKPEDIPILGKSRLRELYYAILKGEAGESARRAFGVGNAIPRAIDFLSSNIQHNVTIDDLACHVGMSRAVFHRKFKQATNLSPIQFIKSMRLNNAAMRIAEGTNVSVAAEDVGYVSSSQFSRDFKRLYGVTPKQWGLNQIRNRVNEQAKPPI